MKIKNQQLKNLTNSSTDPSPITKQSFIEHVYELRRRLFICAASVISFSVIGYFIQERIVDILLHPAQGQHFIYTSPGGGINFLFTVCIDFGLALSVPVIIYQILAFLEPLTGRRSTWLIIRYCLFSVALAAAGLCFGYFVGLPAALHFLAHQFRTESIEALFTIQEYLSFILIYLLGSALIFQIPLILLFINRIKPLKPSKLFGLERYVILGAFIIAAFITPTPDIFNQSLLAGPIIAIYQVGVVLVWLANRQRKSTSYTAPVVIEQTAQEAEPEPTIPELVTMPRPQRLFMDIKPRTAQ